jgi:hypothetical protein
MIAILHFMFGDSERANSVPAILAKGSLGIAAAVTAKASATDLAGYLQLTALILGILVTLLTIISLVLTIERKWRIRSHERSSGHILNVKDER